MKRTSGDLRKMLVAGAVIVLCLLWAASGFAQGPSFDCSKAKTKVEKTICGDEELSKLDRELSEIYKSLLNKLSETDRGLLKTRQVEWTWQRDRNCEGKPQGAEIPDCLQRIYLKRIADLKERQKSAVAKKGKESASLGSNCWKRTTPPWPGGEGNYPLCRAFEEVLNTTCEPPKKLICNWTLPPGEKRFRKLRWDPIDPKENWELVKDLRAVSAGEKQREYRWKQLGEKTEKAYADGRRRLFVSTADIDRDGIPDRIVREEFLPCEESGGRMFGVLAPRTNRIDWRFGNLIGDLNMAEGGEILLYDGTAFMFGWLPGNDRVRIWEGFSGVDPPHPTGSIIVCDFLCTGKPE